MKLGIWTEINEDEEIKIYADVDGLDNVLPEEVTAMITELELQKLWLLSFYDKRFHKDKKAKVKLI